MTIAASQTRTDPGYLLRRDTAETRRLIDQASLYKPFTQRLFQEAGISPGMTVLDIGSGAGDVAFLAAERVGPTGRVIGVDWDAGTVDIARSRAEELGLHQVTFVHSDCRTIELEMTFDAVVGRLVLLYMADPAGALRSICARLRPGGIVTAHEITNTPGSIRSWPPLPIWQQVLDWIQSAFDQAGLRREMGFALRQVFLDAGLPEPRMHLDSRVGGGPDWEGYAYFANSIRSMSPLIVQSGRATLAELDLDSLEDRLRDATLAADAVVKTPDMITAWAAMPT
jgi:ubiquinone/menaquinone biosynthesis C-methylase UbiE